MPIIGIYKITNKINNKVYIGRSYDIKKRWNYHKYSINIKKNKYLLKNSFKHYGIENFTFEILREFSENSLTDIFLNVYEKFYIEKYNSVDRNFGYNLTYGGTSSYIISEETREKMSKMAKEKKPASKETREKMSKMFKGEKNPFFGKKHSEKTRKLISEKGKQNDKFKGSNNPSAKKIINLETKEIFEYASLACKKYNLDLSTVIKCCRGIRKSTGGYHWEYYKKEENKNEI